MMRISSIFDGLLVLQYRSGDRKALGILVTRYHRKLCRHAYWYIRDAEASADVVQDSWQMVIRHLGSLKDPNKFGPWAMKIVTRKSLDYLELKKRQKEMLQDELHTRQTEAAALDPLQHNREQLQRLKAAIGELSREHQEVLRLFYLEGYTLKDMGTILELSVGTVKSRLFHAREKLKTILIK